MLFRWKRRFQKSQRDLGQTLEAYRNLENKLAAQVHTCEELKRERKARTEGMKEKDKRHAMQVEGLREEIKSLQQQLLKQKAMIRNDIVQIVDGFCAARPFEVGRMKAHCDEDLVISLIHEEAWDEKSREAARILSMALANLTGGNIIVELLSSEKRFISRSEEEDGKEERTVADS
jgi:seryl-tRNA synthetase